MLSNVQVRAIAILTFGGEGRRFKWIKPKQFYPVSNERSVIRYVVRKFVEFQTFQTIVVVSNQRWMDETRLEVERALEDVEPATGQRLTFPSMIVSPGGDSRERSVWNGLMAIDKLANEDDIILVHDGARPLVSRELVLRNLEACAKHGAVVSALRASDTVTLSSCEKVQRILKRESVYLHQTPQTFRYGLLRRCMELKFVELELYSDEATLVASCGESVFYVEGEPTNLKITTIHDAELIKLLISVTER